MEHLLCCSYLFAAFSLKTEVSEGVTATQLDVIARWKAQIRAIAVQEMAHLARVSNLLTAVGGAPHFGRPNFPQHGKYYPGHLPLSLTPFSEETLARFIELERPEGPASGPAPRGDQASTDGAAVMPQPQTYPSVGALYSGIEAGLRFLVDRYGESQVFVGPVAAQPPQHEIPLPEVHPVTDLASAVEAIRQIVAEGEGRRGDRENTHFDRFVRIQTEYQTLTAADPQFQPARPVVANPSTRPFSDASRVTLVDHPAAVAGLELFNASYGLMVQLLARYFAHGGETREELETLLQAAVTIMAEVLTPLGEALTRWPASRSGDDRTAGPSFEFHRAIQALPHRTAARVRFRERAGELADHANRLVRDARTAATQVQVSTALRNVEERFGSLPPTGAS